VIEGKYKGDTGRVIDVNGRMVCVILDKTQQEIQNLAHCFKLKTDSDMPMDFNLGGGSLSGKSNGYSAFDLIHYNGTKNAGLILQVHEDSVKVINE